MQGKDFILQFFDIRTAITVFDWSKLVQWIVFLIFQSYLTIESISSVFGKGTFQISTFPMQA